MDGLWGSVERILGLRAEELGAWHMAVRALIVYVATLLMVRIGEKRFLGKSTAFDIVLGIMVGSVVSRAITGSAPFFPSLAAGLVLILSHWLFAALAFHSSAFATLIKGSDRVLVRNGEIQWEAMRKSHIGENDLKTALRIEAGAEDLSSIKEARLERSGDISLIQEQRKPQILEVDVTDGVQTVRIRLE
jgi:uncharacterized membrane protein YcaP (DUF421 family)